VELPFAEHSHSVDRHDPGPHQVRVDQRLLREVDVAVDAEVLHDSPRTRHRQTRTGALHVRRRIESTQPVVEHERLVLAGLLRVVEDDRHTLRRVAQLVNVRRNRGHPVNPKVPRQNVAPDSLGERQHEAAHAGVDMAVCTN
jgi:hypothetical protein